MDRTRRSGPGGTCRIEGINHGSGVLIEGLHVRRQNLSTIRVAEQLSIVRPEAWHAFVLDANDARRS
jgi:hypothetical protein